MRRTLALPLGTSLYSASMLLRSRLQSHFDSTRPACDSLPR